MQQELLTILQSKLRACSEHGEPINQAIRKATDAVNDAIRAKIKQAPQEKSMILTVVHELEEFLSAALEDDEVPA